MMENALSILIIFSVQLQQTETKDRKLFIFQQSFLAARNSDNAAKVIPC